MLSKRAPILSNSIVFDDDQYHLFECNIMSKLSQNPSNKDKDLLLNCATSKLEISIEEEEKNQPILVQQRSELINPRQSLIKQYEIIRNQQKTSSINDQNEKKFENKLRRIQNGVATLKIFFQRKLSQQLSSPKQIGSSLVDILTLISSEEVDQKQQKQSLRSGFSKIRLFPMQVVSKKRVALLDIKKYTSERNIKQIQNIKEQKLKKTQAAEHLVNLFAFKVLTAKKQFFTQINGNTAQIKLQNINKDNPNQVFYNQENNFQCKKINQSQHCKFIKNAHFNYKEAVKILSSSEHNKFQNTLSNNEKKNEVSNPNNVVQKMPSKQSISQAETVNSKKSFQREDECVQGIHPKVFFSRRQKPQFKGRNQRIQESSVQYVPTLKILRSKNNGLNLPLKKETSEISVSKQFFQLPKKERRNLDFKASLLQSPLQGQKNYSDYSKTQQMIKIYHMLPETSFKNQETEDIRTNFDSNKNGSPVQLNLIRAQSERGKKQYNDSEREEQNLEIKKSESSKNFQLSFRKLQGIKVIHSQKNIKKPFPSKNQQIDNEYFSSQNKNHLFSQNCKAPNFSNSDHTKAKSLYFKSEEFSENASSLKQFEQILETEYRTGPRNRLNSSDQLMKFPLPHFTGTLGSKMRANQISNQTKTNNVEPSKSHPADSESSESKKLQNIHCFQIPNQKVVKDQAHRKFSTYSQILYNEEKKLISSNLPENSKAEGNLLMTFSPQQFYRANTMDFSHPYLQESENSNFQQKNRLSRSGLQQLQITNRTQIFQAFQNQKQEKKAIKKYSQKVLTHQTSQALLATIAMNKKEEREKNLIKGLNILTSDTKINDKKSPLLGLTKSIQLGRPRSISSSQQMLINSKK